MTTAYTLRVREPEARRVEFDIACDTGGADFLEFRIPVWTPGSYLIREHQRHVDGFIARDENGAPLPSEKSDKHTWRVTCLGKRRVTVSYRLHCFELTVRTNHVDPSHAFINPAAACAFVVGRENQPCELRMETPLHWQTWVALPMHAGAYVARDFDELADSPIEAGPMASHQYFSFQALGVAHDVVVWGKGDLDERRLGEDMRKIVEAEAAWFGGLPYREPYLFIIHLNDRGRGGLEHRRSCALLGTRFAFGSKSGYEDFLQLVAHELYHLWNVKRLRPAAFTPYDWTRENHTTLLWAMEGLTSFYELLALRRAGLCSPQRFLELWAERVTSLLRTPGRNRTPLAQASFDAWIKHYRPDETTANTSVSYYLKGSIVGLLLDLELRRRTQGQRSLDDVMRLLYQRHAEPPGLPEDGVEAAVLELLPESERATMALWFARALRSTQPLELEQALAGVGLSAIISPADGSDDRGGAEEDPDDAPAVDAARAWLGAGLRERNGLLEVTSVVEGGPAQLSGVCVGDEIAALEGFRSDMKTRLSRAAVGQVVKLSVFRMDELIELPVRLQAAPRDTVTFVPDAKATPEQIALRTQWLGEAWPEDEARA
ncbi:MAG: M61 family metallopeptidase [Deltaproteobacteria bacterium]|nr:M61 family metallopeptidase [Deltaproteobacteria bacterium]